MDKYQIPSVAKACQLLQLLAANSDGLSATHLEAELGLPRTTVFRLLKTLCAEALVEKRGKQFVSGPGMLNLGFQALQSDKLRQQAAGPVQQLAQRTGLGTHLAVPNSESSLIIEVCNSAQHPKIACRPGVSTLLHASATGKVFLAFKHFDQLERLFAGRYLAALTCRTITEPEALRKELKRVIALGYALDDREYHDEVSCLAVPIRDTDGTVVAALGCTGPAGDFKGERITQLVGELKDTASAIYKAVYHRQPEPREKSALPLTYGMQASSPLMMSR
ncbi:MAG: IclR family transcriptional regulator [Pseudomonadota bacterium]|uniref:IclR family transcriptional regulator n=1 Tax=Gallaecimonas pentaromativorans TaxID=584787 RepID=UPI00067EC8D3|nr:IclR family transcriptional regulator [Gallaecimonas pentaromativorans]MED5525168.1 IclR family transcriptional regulator [Pseudomonadota bacterium]